MQWYGLLFTMGPAVQSNIFAFPLPDVGGVIQLCPLYRGNP